MNLTCRGFGRIALFTAGSLVFTACSNVPLSRSTSEMSNAMSVSPAPALVMPVALPDNPRPSYPAALLMDGQTGAVSVLCLVNERGEIVHSTVQNSTHPAFTTSTMQALRQWKFQPGSRDGVPAPMMIVVPVEFATVAAVHP